MIWIVIENTFCGLLLTMLIESHNTCSHGEFSYHSATGMIMLIDIPIYIKVTTSWNWIEENTYCVCVREREKEHRARRLWILCRWLDCRVRSYFDQRYASYFDNILSAWFQCCFSESEMLPSFRNASWSAESGLRWTWQSVLVLSRTFANSE